MELPLTTKFVFQTSWLQLSISITLAVRFRPLYSNLGTHLAKEPNMNFASLFITLTLVLCFTPNIGLTIGRKPFIPRSMTSWVLRHTIASPSAQSVLADSHSSASIYPTKLDMWRYSSLSCSICSNCRSCWERMDNCVVWSLDRLLAYESDGFLSCRWGLAVMEMVPKASRVGILRRRN